MSSTPSRRWFNRRRALSCRRTFRQTPPRTRSSNRGALREFHEASVRQIKEYERALAAAIEKVKVEGSEAEAAGFIANAGKTSQL